MKIEEYQSILKMANEGKYNEALEKSNEFVKNNDMKAYELLSDLHILIYEHSGLKDYLKKAKDYLNLAEKNGLNVSVKKFFLLLHDRNKKSIEKFIEDEKDIQIKNFLKSLVLLEENKIDKAKELLQQLAIVKPKINEYYIVYYKILFSEKEYEKALNILRTGIENISDEFIKYDLSAEYFKINYLLNVNNKNLIMGLYAIENNRWILMKTNQIETKSIDEFINLIGIDVNDRNHMILVIPMDKKLFDMIKLDFFSILPEKINKKDFEYMVAQINASIG